MSLSCHSPHVGYRRRRIRCLSLRVRKPLARLGPAVSVEVPPLQAQGSSAVASVAALAA